MDVTYKYAGTGAAPYGPTFVVHDSWVDWLKKVWVDSLTASTYIALLPPWKPTYESVVVAWPGNDGAMQSAALNPLQFPTKETCDTLAARYAIEGKALIIKETPFLGLGPIVSFAIHRSLIHPLYPNLPSLDAYQLANYFTNNPEDKSDAADALCRLYIAKVWPDK